MLAALLVVILAVRIWFAPLMASLAKFLAAGGQPAPANVAFVLNGDFLRFEGAGRLYNDGFVPRVAVVESELSLPESLGLAPTDVDLGLEIMTAMGVPRDSIFIVSDTPRVTSTFDEARVLARLLEERGWDTVLVVTTDLHARRARWIIERVLDESAEQNRRSRRPVIRVIGVPNSRYDLQAWWRSEDGLIAVNNEFLKYVFYRLSY